MTTIKKDSENIDQLPNYHLLQIPIIKDFNEPVKQNTNNDNKVKYDGKEEESKDSDIVNNTVEEE